MSWAGESEWIKITNFFNALHGDNTTEYILSCCSRLTNQPYAVYCLTAVVLILICIHRWIGIPYYKDYILAEGFHFSVESSDPIKVGDDVVCSISGFMSVPSMGDNDYAKEIFNGITAKVEIENERIPATKEYAEDDQRKIKITFIADRSGTYNVELKFNQFLIPGSPFLVTVPPDFLCPEETEVILPSTPIVLTVGMPQTILISPKDRTGFPCSEEGVKLDKFDFHSSTEKAYTESLGKSCELLSGDWKERLDANFTYHGSSFQGDRIKNRVTVMLVLRTNSPYSYGILEGQLVYDSHILKNGCFPIITLKAEEYERLEPTLSEPKPSDVIQLKAELLQPFTGRFNESDQLSQGFKTTEEISKEIYVNVSLKFICIKEVVWTVLLARSALFKIQGDTKVEVIPETDAKDKYIVIISDTQNEIRCLMSAQNTRMLMAVYLKFRASTRGNTQTYSEKEESFLDSLKAHVLKKTSTHHASFQLLKISRPDVLMMSFMETQRFKDVHWFSPFIVSFVGEPLMEGEAGWLEWSELLLDTMLENNPIGMFHRISEVSNFVHPNQYRNLKRWSIQYYELAGKIVGKCLVERALQIKSLNYRVRVRFSRSFLQQLIGSPPNAISLERDMPEFYESTLTTLTKTNLHNGLITFTIPEYDIYGKLDRLVPLIENGENIQVTPENKDFYLDSLARYQLTTQVTREIQAFRAGFTSLVPEDFLLNFDENELELLICGWSKLDTRELRKFYKTVGEQWHTQFPRILKWFFNSLTAMSVIDQAKFLQFCTGSCVLPLGGFAQLKPQLTISMTCLYGQLPAADPSTHCICLSDHPNFESFQTALLTAIQISPCCQTRPKRCDHEENRDSETLPRVLNQPI